MPVESVCACTYIYLACGHAHTQTHIYIYTQIYINIHAYIHIFGTQLLHPTHLILFDLGELFGLLQDHNILG